MTEMTRTDKAPEEKATLEQKASPKLFQCSGRIGRAHFLFFYCLTSLVPSVAILITAVISFLLQSRAMTELLVPPIFLAIAFALVMNIIICIRRLNDINTKGWWSLAILLPAVNLILLAILLSYPGTKGINNYGEQPPSPSKDALAVIVVFSVITVLIITYSSLRL